MTGSHAIQHELMSLLSLAHEKNKLFGVSFQSVGPLQQQVRVGQQALPFGPNSRSSSWRIRILVGAHRALPHPLLNFVGEGDHRAAALAGGPVHRKLQVALVALDCAHTPSHVIGYLFPRIEDETLLHDNWKHITPVWSNPRRYLLRKPYDR